MNFLILLAVALVISCIGFYKYVYFISLGYGFSIAGIGIALLILYPEQLTIPTILACVLFIIYGCRLGGYLLVREIKSASYRSTMKREIKDGSDMKMIAKVSIWRSGRTRTMVLTRSIRHMCNIPQSCYRSSLSTV